MSGSMETLASRCDELSSQNDAMELQITRLSCLLAEALNVLDAFSTSAKDKLRHFELSKNSFGRYDPKKLKNR